MPFADPAPDLAVATKFATLAGTRAWRKRLAELTERAQGQTMTARAVQQRHAIELALGRFGEGARVGLAERRIAAIAEEAVQLAKRLPAPARARLQERLAEALSGEGTLVPLFHMLRTAALQRARGYEVRFDGITDDTAAVQRAMNSGKPVVWFPKAAYVINGTVAIPRTVREIAFLHASVYRTVSAEPGFFRVAEPSTEPLLIHDNVNAGGVFVDHEADRPLILEDVEILFSNGRYFAKAANMVFPGPAAQTADIWQLYRNTRPDAATKEVFANNVMGFAVGGEKARHAVENVRAWIRQLDNEYYPYAETAFRRSDVWILGTKWENHDGVVVFHVDQGSRLELLGGTLLAFNKKRETGHPIVLSRDSEVSMTFMLWGFKENPPSEVLRSESKGTVSIVPPGQFPNARAGAIVIPLLVNPP